MDLCRASANAVSLQPGRCLLFAPEWSCSEAGVVFDCNSGDYWVVSLLASMALKHLQANGAMTPKQIEQQLEPLQIYSDLRSALELTIQSLVDNGLVRTAP